MSKPKHTPGKWKIGAEAQELICNGKLTRRYIPIYEGAVNQPHWAANEPTDHPHPIIAGVHIGDEEETAANAHLIAAAPELYEALESARDLLLSIDGDYLSASANKEINEEIERIDKILLKARGENTNQFADERQKNEEV